MLGETAHDLRQQTTTGHIQPSKRHPSEVDLADRYKVSTVTRRSALAVLQSEGLIQLGLHKLILGTLGV
ncbi:GntR family transcriptional regulator [Streptomyces sp. NPDC048306]|uniref:GntR family transcriptional regulator n=1 Tax=Streptomyces sp. NPDC048306 TaxID=3154502 RepID=UPI0033D62F3F